VPADATRIGMEYTCDDLAHLMDRAKLDQAVIFGHSMGVQVALEFHRRHRARVKALVLICGSYGTPLDTWHDHTLLRVAFPFLKRFVERAPELSRVLISRVANTPLALQIGILAELNAELMKVTDFAPYMEHLAKMHPLYFVRTLDSAKDHSALDHLPFIDVPTLVIGGEGDKFTPIWLSQRMAEQIPQAEYVFVPGGTHTAPLERPNLVNQAVGRFLEHQVRGATAAAALP
jgi:pimeloyl-ACP methyl ester carboxylesterase